METTPQAPPTEKKRRSNLLTPEQGVDVRFKDILKLFGLQILLQGLTIALYPKSLPEGNEMLFYPLMTLLFLWAYRHYAFWPSFSDFGLTREKFQSSWKVGVLWGAGAQILSIAIGLLLAAILGPWAEWARLSAEPPIYLWGWAVYAIGAVICAPLVEEIMMRGVIFGTAHHKYGRCWAIGITAVVFALMHGINPVTFVQILLVGTTLTLLYERERNLAAPVIAHACFNLIAVVVKFFCPFC